jgi:RNA polymerase sigma-B factor
VHANGLDETTLLRRYAATRDPALKDLLVRRYLPLCRTVARRFDTQRVPLDDLVQVAAIGMLKALDRYDPDRRVAFSSYAVPTITGELQRHLRDHSWSVRPPRALLELSTRIRRTERDLTSRLRRPPTIAEIAAEIGVSPELVVEGLEAATARDGASFDEPWPGSDGAATVGDSIGQLDAGLDRVEDGITIDLLSGVLDRRERQVLWLRFHTGLKQREIAARVGCSQMHVSRLIRVALAKLSDAAERENGAARHRAEPDALEALLD